MSKNIYIGINLSHDLSIIHDLSISILIGGEIYALELERIFKIKKFDNDKLEIKSGLDKIISYSIDYISRGLLDNKIDNIYIISDKYINFSGENFYNIVVGNHHLLHACSTYYGSNFEKSAVLIMDFFGEFINGDNINYEYQTMRFFDGNKYDKLHSSYSKNNFDITGIGAIYYILSKILKLEEGSVMGLSGYGDRKVYSNIKLFTYDGDDVYLDKKIINRIKFNESLGIKYNYILIAERLKKLYNINKEDYTENDITKSKFADIATHLQYEVENAIIYLANRLYNKTKCENLCLSGGVALNILANTKILEKTPFKKIFVQPAANDGGLSLGALYYGYNIYHKNTNRILIKSAGIGLEYSNDQILNIIKKYEKYLAYSYEDNIIEISSKILSEGKIIGWFQGKSEFGPRSLGYRSILADPRSVSIRNKVNKIKNRQYWRPLAPVVLEEDLGDYFLLNIKSPYMTLSSKVVIDKIKLIPGIVHIDGTARYQTVNKKENEKYYKLIKEFKKYTGIPVLINTSFNFSGQPIVESPEDAIETFLSTDLDYLIIGDFIISKNKIYEKFSYNNEKYFKKLKLLL